MIIAVTDANIFIDLIKLDLLGYLFDLGYSVHTTAEVYNQLNDDQEKVAKAFVQSNQLLVYYFSVNEYEELMSIDFPRSLELADRSVFFYASKQNGIVLTGDKALRNHCQKYLQQVNGIIWFFDQLYTQNKMPPNLIANKIKQLLSFNNRLPINECETRITKWSKNK